ncbi:DUF6236 family protein [Brevibacillus porteri]|uniref:DUF6236 family protein n=1 Tax=Brevibacillus porteri TaxID=2126350 RepID=UPI003630B696
MRRTILYYPSIVIPDGIWLKKSLLYWDEVSSIVPRNLDYEDRHSEYWLKYLEDEGEYRPTYPDQLMAHEIYHEFEEEMIGKYRSYQRMKKSINRGLESRSRFMNDSTQDYYKIHRDKMTYMLFRMLKEDQNKSDISENDWLLVERNVADMYMSTLAKYLALADVNNTVIGTDQIRSINKVYPVNSKSKKPTTWNNKPVFNLSINILPVPHLDTSYKKIIQFKRKYRDDLLSFRRIINDYEQQISTAESQYQIKESTIMFKEKIEKGTRETMKMLKGSGINCFLSSLRSIINIKSPAMLSTIAGVTGQKLEIFPPTLVGTFIVGAGTLDLALNYMSIKNSTYEKLTDKGFLYLYHARRQGIIQDFT